MDIVVLGGGKVGYYLCRALIEQGHQPSLIEEKKASCSFIANDLQIPVICGDGTSLEVLRQAGAEHADALICVTGSDEDNLVACQLCKKIFNINRTVAKVNNPKNTDVMRKLGIDTVINSTDEIVSIIEREVDATKIKKLISLNKGESSISEVELPANFALSGKTLMEIEIPNDSIIITIIRNDVTIIPRGQTQIFAGDKILILSKNTSLPQINHALKL